VSASPNTSPGPFAPPRGSQVPQTANHDDWVDPATIRRILTTAADAYEADIRATRHLHPRQALTWPHTDVVHWLRTEAARTGDHTAQTEPGS
jgi:hypothetical protein